MAKVSCAPRSGRVGDEVYVRSRYGQIVRKFVPPRNPRSPRQQANRANFGALASQWHGLTPEAQSAWCVRAETDRTGLSGYHYFMKLNPARVHIGLTRLDLPPDHVPALPVNPVSEAVVTNTGGTPNIKLYVPSPPAEFTLVEVTGPVSAGVRCVTGYCYVGLLPASENSYSDITALIVARYGQLIPGQAFWIRVRQQVDGWMDEPKVFRVVIPSG